MLNVKLGKLPPKHDVRTLALARYTAGLPPAPAAVDWTGKLVAPLGQMGNDQRGDCTCAGMGHAVQVWSANCGTQVTIPDADILKAYEDACGYNPASPSTDQGGVELDVLKWWRKNPIAGHSIDGFASVQPGSIADVKDAIWLFGGAYLGIELPETAQSQDIWAKTGSPSLMRWLGFHSHPDPAPGSWGGHCVFACAYDNRGLTCITWGMLKRMSWDFFATYCVTPETRILADDLKWIPAGKLKIGDGIMGFDEDGPRRRWRGAFVEDAPIVERPCYELEFEDGSIVRCSAEHQWLCATSGWAGWLRTDRMRCGGKMVTRVIKPVDLWDVDATRDGGYLAAAFDGEGHLTQTDLTGKRYSLGASATTFSMGAAATTVGFSQKDNCMLREVQNLLSQRNFRFKTNNQKCSGVRVVNINRRSDLLRFLGSIRPIRLLEKFDPYLMGGLSGDRRREIALIRKTDIGVQKVVALKTTSATFIADGFASHNCSEAYALLSKDWAAVNEAPSGFAWDALNTDLGSFT